MKLNTYSILPSSLLLLCALTNQSSFAAEDHWQTPEGYAFVEDISDIKGPVAIRFLPPSEQGPLYLVSELRGGIVTVSKDRVVERINMDDTLHQPSRDLPHFDGETGQIGLCMSPDYNYIYTTGVLKKGWAKVNKITRWRHAPGQRWKKLIKDKEVIEPFYDSPAGNAHQIGHCHVMQDGKVWVGVGDGHNDHFSHSLDHPVGKLLRLNLDLTNPDDNPFFDKTNPQSIPGMVWARGLRNPFAITQLPGGGVYIADNGPGVDRLLKVEKGIDFPWDGSDDSMAYRNELTWRTSIGPADMVYVPEDHPFKEFRGHFLIAASHAREIHAVPYRAGYGVTATPRIIVKPKTMTGMKQEFSGIAIGPDGIYVSSIRIDPKGGILPGPMLKLARGKNASLASSDVDADDLIKKYNCQGCHTINNAGSTNVGPNLDVLVTQLRMRLTSPSYVDHLQKVEASVGNADSFSKIRQRLIKQKGTVDQRVRVWIESKLKNPKFENPGSSMAQLDMPDKDIKKLADYFIVSVEHRENKDQIDKLGKSYEFYLGQNPRFPLAVALFIGLVLGLLIRQVVLIVTMLVKGALTMVGLRKPKQEAIVSQTKESCTE